MSGAIPARSAIYKESDMKELITISLLILILLPVSGIQYCGIRKGFYVDVRPEVYNIYSIAEKLTQGYIQIDSNY